MAILWRFFRRHRITLKKSRRMPPSRTARHPEPALGLVRGPVDLEPELVFIDETWASTKMARRTAGPRGERLRAAVPHGHWKTTTFVAGLRLTGMIAPMVLDGPINGVAFLAYVDQVLAPKLQPGDIVIMDNLGSHKGPASAPRSRPSARGCSTCRPTAPTSIRSRTPSQSSKPCCARPPNAPSKASGTPSGPVDPSPHRMRQLLRRRWLRCRLIGNCSRARGPADGLRVRFGSPGGGGLA